MYVFGAAIFILRESRTGGIDGEVDWMSEVDQCVEYLEEARLGNAVAFQALELLNGLL
jgi:hypothetical protein